MDRQLLEERELRLKVLRFPKHSDVAVQKGDQDLGLTLKKPRSGLVHELLVMGVLPEGAVARHNSLHALGGKWDQIILPRMCITGVNGIEGDLERMMESLRTCETAQLRLRRSGALLSGPVQARMERLVRLGVALRALRKAPEPQSEPDVAYRRGVESQHPKEVEVANAETRAC
eukprot:UN3913